MTEMEYLFSWTQNLTFYVRCLFVLFAFTHCLASEHYTIYRAIQVGFPQDTFKIPTSVCGLQTNCNSFQAKKADKTCQCSCGLNKGKRSTFGLYNGTWSCVYDKGLRLREGCSLLLSSEMPDSAITILPSDELVKYPVRWPTYHCTIDGNSARYQDCDGKWIPIRNAAKKFQYRYRYHIGYYLQVLEELNGQSFSYLHGKLIKLGFDCSYWGSGSYRKDCLLFKLSGTLSCPGIPREQTSSVKPIEPTSTVTMFTTSVIIQPTTTTMFTPTQTTTTTTIISTTTTTKTVNSTRKTDVAATQSSIVQQSSGEFVETQAIKPSQAIQAGASSPAIHTVSPGNVDRREDGGDESIFAVIGGVTAAVFVVVATLAAVIAIRRKRNEQNNGSKRNKSSLHRYETSIYSLDSVTCVVELSIHDERNVYKLTDVDLGVVEQFVIDVTLNRPVNAHCRPSTGRATTMVEPTSPEELTKQQIMADDGRRVLDIVATSRGRQSRRVSSLSF